MAILVVLLALGSYVGVRAYRRHRVDRALPVAVTPAVFASATEAPSTPPGSDAPVPAASTVTAAVRGPLAAAALGPTVLADVVDAATAAPLYASGAGTAAAPASTAKLATAAAVLAVHGPADTITTRVVAGRGLGSVVLVGGGDPTLTAAATGSTYAGAARLADLAAAVRRAGIAVTSVVVDGSLFSGPTVSPAWAPGDAPSTFAAPVTALLVDGARDAPGAESRSADPDLAAGRALADLLGVPDAPVTRGAAPAGARLLGAVRSAPYSTLVRQMLADSDDVLADVLARQVALATGAPASFTGAAAAVRAVLRAQGLDIGAGLVDGSGLAASDRLSPETLVALLRLLLDSPRLRPALDGLPVAGWDGTLADRFVGASAGRGLVRAKTGTLTGVSTLAGLVHDRSGQLLAFSFVADAVGPTEDDTDAAEAALDAAASALARL